MPDRPAPEPSGHRDAVFGICEHDGRLLLVRNPRTVRGVRRSLWDLPGGAVHAGESLLAALRREWVEETGLEADVGRLRMVVDGAKRRERGAPALYTWRAFAFEVLSRGEPHVGHGIDEVCWVNKAKALRLLDAPYHGPLQTVLAGSHELHHPFEWIEASPRSGASSTPLSGELRRLLVMSAAAAVGDAGLAAREAESALAEGVAAPRIEEALLQVVPYAGFPRTIAAFGRVREVLGPHRKAAGPGPAVSCATGGETFDRVYGDTAASVRRGLALRHPDLAAWTSAFAYGKVLSRPALTLLERELLAVSILTALGGLDDPLLGHMRAVVRLGGSHATAAAAVEVVPHDVGEGKRERARALLSRL